jgi:hypothetical protein
MLKILSRTLLVVVSSLVGASPALGQSSSLPRDSAATDSATRVAARVDTVRRAHGDAAAIGYAVLPATIVGAFVAAPFALWIGPRGDTRMSFLADHEAVSLSVAGRFTYGQTWANSVEIESVRSGVHSELQVEDYWRPHHLRYFTLRAGPLWHPRRYSAGGVTLGYVHTEGDPLQRGPELGLPLFVGTRTGNARFEPTYIFSRDGILWSYRIQLEGSIPHSPFFAGANATWKSLTLTSDSRQDFAANVFGVMLGSTF